MTTTNPTTRERVQQAVMRQFELLAERETAQGVVSAATAKHNTLKNSPAVETVRTRASSVKDKAEKVAQTEYDQQVEAGSKPLAAAQTKFDSLEGQARETRQNTFNDAERKFQTKVDAAQKEYELEMAATEAGVYRAKKEVTAIENTMSQHSEVIKQQLGIDLNTLTNTIE